MDITTTYLYKQMEVRLTGRYAQKVIKNNKIVFVEVASIRVDEDDVNPIEKYWAKSTDLMQICTDQNFDIKNLEDGE